MYTLPLTVDLLGKSNQQSLHRKALLNRVRLILIYTPIVFFLLNPGVKLSILTQSHLRQAYSLFCLELASICVFQVPVVGVFFFALGMIFAIIGTVYGMTCAATFKPAKMVYLLSFSKNLEI